MHWIKIDEAMLDENHFYVIRYKAPMYMYFTYAVGIFNERDKCFFCRSLKRDIQAEWVSHICLVDFPQGETE